MAAGGKEAATNQQFDPRAGNISHMDGSCGDLCCNCVGGCGLTDRLADRGGRGESARAPGVVPAARVVLGAAAIAVVYVAVALGCIALSRLGNGLATVWLPVSVSIAIAMRWKPSPLWPVPVAVFLAAAVAQMISGRPLPVSLGMALGSSLEATVAVLLIRRFVPVPTPPTLRAALVVMLITVVIAPALSAGIGGIVLAGFSGVPFRSVFASWWGISAWGSAVVMPIAMVASRRALDRALRPQRAVALLLLLLAVSAMTTAAFLLTPYPFVIMTVVVLGAVMWLNAFSATLTGIAIVTTVVVLQLGGALDAGETVSRFFSAALVSVLPFLLAAQKDALRQSEKAARQSEALFRRAMEDSAIGMALVGLDGRFLRVNDALCSLLGYPREELLALSFTDVTFEADRPRSLLGAQRLLRGEAASMQAEKRYRRKDGTVIWGGLASSLVQDATTGEPEFFISQVQDIDERRKAQAQLADAESRWHFALESARQGVWDHVVRTGEVFVSPVWKALLGYREDEFDTRQTPWLSLVHPDDRPRIEALEALCVDGAQDFFECEFRMRHKDGHWIWLLDRGRVIERDDTGRAVRLIGTHTDISERRRTEQAVRGLNERFRLAMTAAEVGLFECDLDHESLLWDERMLQLYRCKPQDFAGRFSDWVERIHPDDLATARREFDEMVLRGRVIMSDYRIVRDDGAIRYVHTVGQLIAAQGEAPRRIIGVQWDVTAQVTLTQALAEEKERLRITLHSIGDGVICTDAAANVTFMNPVAEQLTGRTLAEASGEPAGNVFVLVHEEDGQPIDDPVREALHSRATVSTPDGALLVNSRDERFSVHQTSAPVATASGEVLGAVLVFQDVTGARALQKALAYSASHDALTGLPNRSAFEKMLADLSMTVAIDGRHHALAYIDLDRFKIVNDTAGHAAGDALLREVARSLRAALPASDIVARLGGDEFAVLLHDSRLDEADLACRRIIDALGRVRFRWEGRTYDIGASVGLAAIAGTALSADDLMKQADVACYAAKAAGRNRVSLYTAGAGDAERHYREIHVAAGIRAALESNRFRLYAQEIRDLGAGARAGSRYEILLRMLDEDGTVLTPAAFIPAAERYDLMGIIDRWVISTLLRAYRDDLRRHPAVEITINLSANSLSDPLLWPFVQNEIRISGIAPERLHFEITETTLVNNFPVAREFVAQIRSTGSKVVLDDFGTGLSSFAYLKQFEVDAIKIDGTFVRHMAVSQVDRRIVESINDIGHALGLCTVAEFVESEAILEEVRAIGIDRAQGYCIGRPRPLGEVLCTAQA